MDQALLKELHEALALYRMPVEAVVDEPACQHEGVKTDLGDIVCCFCGEVLDDFVLDNDIVVYSDHAKIKQKIPYLRKAYFMKNIKYFKGFQQAKPTDDTMLALLISKLQKDPFKLATLFVRLGLQKQVKQIPWLLSIQTKLVEPLEGCINLMYSKVLAVYDKYKLNKKKFIPFGFCIKFFAKTLGIAIPALAEQSNALCKNIPCYKVKANEERNASVLIKCIEGINLSHLYQDIMNYLNSYRLTHLRDRLKYDVQSLDPGRALAELGRMEGIHDDLVYNPIDESARKAALVIGKDLPIRLVGQDNFQKELAVEGIATVDPKAPILIVNDPLPQKTSVVPNSGQLIIQSAVPPEEIMPSTSARALEIAKARILMLEQQTKAYKEAVSVTRNLLAKNK